MVLAARTRVALRAKRNARLPFYYPQQWPNTLLLLAIWNHYEALQGQGVYEEAARALRGEPETKRTLEDALEYLPGPRANS
jgi:hypothetical protein